LNVLLYLNPDWKEEHGGDLQMWDINGCHKRVYPEANTMVVMTTDDRSLHGHPDPLGGGQRDSIALYYYTQAQPMKHCIGKRPRTNYL
jgi:Rps23 Pro-64 3,4-dihydroxylase Tpa1-like proline 4-hydroxylase